MRDPGGFKGGWGRIARERWRFVLPILFLRTGGYRVFGKLLSKVLEEVSVFLYFSPFARRAELFS